MKLRAVALESYFGFRCDYSSQLVLKFGSLSLSLPPAPTTTPRSRSHPMWFLQLENHHMEEKGYAEVTVEADEVAISASPSGTAHALVNIDDKRSTFFLGCQDSVMNSNNSNTDFGIWKDL